MKKAAMTPSAAMSGRRCMLTALAVLLMAFGQGCYESTLAGDPLITDETGSDISTAPDMDEPEPAVVEIPAPVCDDSACMEQCLAMGFAGGQCSGDGDCLCEEEPPGDEICGDDLDNDRDGMVDEGCECVLGDIGDCFTGRPENRGLGACRDGARVCAGDSTSTHWGPCMGSVLPVPEICDDDLDNDCDGIVDIDDDDCNGLVDGADPECEEAEVPLGHCNCCVPGTWRWCDEMVYCAWGRQQCLPDGHWGGCLETSERPPGCEGHVYDLACCVDSGACCQVSAFQPYSLGNCEGIIVPCEI
jgi:hypothetical protein